MMSLHKENSRQRDDWKDARDVEWKYRKREYTHDLKVAGDYHMHKRDEIRRLAYTQEELKLVEGLPDEQEYRQQVNQISAEREKFWDRLFFLAATDDERDPDGTWTIEAEYKVRMIKRLLSLDREKMGKKAVFYMKLNHIEDA